MSTRHSMSTADAAWLRMDRPTNLMIVNSVLWFDEPALQVEERLIDFFSAKGSIVLTTSPALGSVCRSQGRRSAACSSGHRAPGASV